MFWMVLISYLLMGCHLDGLDQACIHHHRQYQTSLSHQNFHHLKEIKPKTTVDKRYITFGLCLVLGVRYKQWSSISLRNQIYQVLIHTILIIRLYSLLVWLYMQDLLTGRKIQNTTSLIHGNHIYFKTLNLKHLQTHLLHYLEASQQAGQVWGWGLSAQIASAFMNA